MAQVDRMVMKVMNRSRLIQVTPIVLGIIALLGSFVFLITHPSVHPVMLFDDYAYFLDYSSFEIPAYISIFSELGFVLWIAGGAFCLLAALIVMSIQQRMKG